MFLPSASQFWLDYGRPLSPNVHNTETAMIGSKVIKCIYLCCKVNSNDLPSHSILFSLIIIIWYKFGQEAELYVNMLRYHEIRLPCAELTQPQTISVHNQLCWYREKV